MNPGRIRCISQIGKFVSLFTTIVLAFPALGLPQIVPGSTGGTLNVSASGSAVYQIPIKVPPGTAGMTPRLSLAYDSHAGAGPIGVGWSIQGLSAISRGPKNFADDGLVAGVSLNADDAIYVDGQRAIPVARSDKSIEYRLRIDNQSRVVATLDAASNPVSFRVQTRSGLIMEYGNTIDSRIVVDSGATIVWACSRILDTCGSYMDVKYFNNGHGDYGVSQVSYTGNVRANTQPFARIDFVYEALEQPVVTYLSGNKVVRDQRLTRIRTFDANNLVTEYAFTYSKTESAGRFVLASLQEFGADKTGFRPTLFDYTKMNAGWTEANNFSPPAPFSSGTIETAGIKVGSPGTELEFAL